MGIKRKEDTTYPSQILIFPKRQCTLGNNQAANEKTMPLGALAKDSGETSEVGTV